jgi:hypothetical protein
MSVVRALSAPERMSSRASARAASWRRSSGGVALLGGIEELPLDEATLLGGMLPLETTPPLPLPLGGTLPLPLPLEGTLPLPLPLEGTLPLGGLTASAPGALCKVLAGRSAWSQSRAAAA